MLTATPPRVENGDTSNLLSSKEKDSSDLLPVSSRIENDDIDNFSSSKEKSSFDLSPATKLQKSKTKEMFDYTGSKDLSSILSEIRPPSLHKSPKVVELSRPIADSTRLNYLSKTLSPKTGPSLTVTDLTTHHTGSTFEHSATRDHTRTRDPLDTYGVMYRTEQPRYSHERSFNSLRGGEYYVNKNKSNSAPKSYPRPKSDIVYGESEHFTTPTYHGTTTVPTFHGTTNTSHRMADVENNQKELKAYMQKLENLQKRLKTQSTNNL